MVVWLLWLMGAYLLGAVPFSYLLGRLGGVDIRTVGSGNVGATNLGRALGKKWGIGGFLLDVAKGALPVALYGAFGPSWPEGPVASLLAWLMVGAAAMLGHIFPVYLGFKGGKGVATGLGVLLAVWPVMTIAGVVAFVVWVGVTKVSGYVSLGSIVASLSLPVTAAVAGVLLAEPGQTVVYVVLALLLAALVVVRHRTNIQRLRAGTESTVAWAGKKPRT